MKGPELVFLHIPKTAGTSQLVEFNRYIGKEHVFWIGMDCPPDVAHYPQPLVGEKSVVGGHKFLSFFPRDLDPLYCAVLRDPLQRAISLFAFYTRPEMALTDHDRKSRAMSHQQMLAKGMDPGSMLNSIRRSRHFRQEISNFQCRYLSRGRSTLAAVRKSLRDHDFLVGSVSYYDSFHRELWDLLGRREATPVNANKSRDNYAEEFLQDERLVSLIQELNKEDRKLVDWVETEHRGLWRNIRDEGQRKERLRSLPRKAQPEKVKRLKWRDAKNLWPRRGPRKLQWPLSRMMVAQPHRLLYTSMPGVVDKIIRLMMLGLSSARHPDALRALGIDRVVGHYSTGLMLEDMSAAEIEAIAASGDYFKFAVVYEPISRLVDIYRRSFVEMPDARSRSPQLENSLADARGATFRQFVQLVASGQCNRRLWLPQSRYLPWLNTYDRLYRPDQLSLLERDLARLRGLAVDVAATAPAPPVIRHSAEARYADTPPPELPTDPADWLNQLVDDAIAEKIKAYYARDFKLYNRIADETGEVTGV